jgi:hypothetical protein
MVKFQLSPLTKHEEAFIDLYYYYYYYYVQIWIGEDINQGVDKISKSLVPDRHDDVIVCGNAGRTERKISDSQCNCFC